MNPDTIRANLGASCNILAGSRILASLPCASATFSRNPEHRPSIVDSPVIFMQTHLTTQETPQIAGNALLSPSQAHADRRCAILDPRMTPNFTNRDPR